METTEKTINLERKTHFAGKVSKITLAGAVVNIGLNKPGVVHISQIRKEPVNRVADVLQVGQEVDVWVRRVQKKTGLVELTMIEPLAMEWRDIKADMIVTGKVTRVENFGAFVEIGAERPAMIHVSELTHDYIKHPSEMLKEGDEVEAKVLQVNRRKRQIKLSIKALQEPPAKLVKTLQAEADDNMPVPTAMEMALRQAMDRSNLRTATSEKRSKKSKQAAGVGLEGILNRTLENKVSATARK